MKRHKEMYSGILFYTYYRVLMMCGIVGVIKWASGKAHCKNINTGSGS